MAATSSRVRGTTGSDDSHGYRVEVAPASGRPVSQAAKERQPPGTTPGADRGILSASVRRSLLRPGATAVVRPIPRQPAVAPGAPCRRRQTDRTSRRRDATEVAWQVPSIQAPGPKLQASPRHQAEPSAGP